MFAILFGAIFTLAAWSVFADVAELTPNPPEHVPLFLWLDLAAMGLAASLLMASMMIPQ